MQKLNCHFVLRKILNNIFCMIKAKKNHPKKRNLKWIAKKFLQMKKSKNRK